MRSGPRRRRRGGPDRGGTRGARRPRVDTGMAAVSSAAGSRRGRPPVMSTSTEESAPGPAASAAAEPFFKLGGVSKSFGGLQALKDVDLEIKPGEIYGLIGPNGAGKSSLFNCVCGLVPADAGTILLKGQEIRRRRPHEIVALGLARTFQAVRVFTSLSITENVEIAYTARTPRQPHRHHVLHLEGARGAPGAARARDPAAGRLCRRPALPPPHGFPRGAVDRPATDARDHPHPDQRAGHHPARRADRRPQPRVGEAGGRADSQDFATRGARSS